MGWRCCDCDKVMVFGCCVYEVGVIDVDLFDCFCIGDIVLLNGLFERVKVDDY